MAFLESYFDESSHEHGDLVLAGYASHVDSWAIFATAWKSCLREYDLPYFRMKDFRNPRSRLIRHLSEHQREELLSILLGLIQRYAVIGVSCRINPDEYCSLVTPLFRSLFGSAYAVAVQLCTLILDRFLNAIPGRGHTLSVLLEDGHQNALDAVKHLRDYKDESIPVDASQLSQEINIIGELAPPPVILGAVGLGGKRNHPPLQAADILAHCTLASSNALCISVLEWLKKTVMHRECKCTKELIQHIIAALIKDEIKRSDRRSEIHQLSRFLGWCGVKVYPIQGGIAIDARSPMPIDIERMLKSDPSISLIPGDDKDNQR